jgi:hypothetical protein
VERAPGGVEVELIDVLDGASDRVVLLLRETLHGARGDVVLRRANVYTVRDGAIVEIWIFEDDQYAVDALIGEE